VLNKTNNIKAGQEYITKALFIWLDKDHTINILGFRIREITNRTENHIVALRNIATKLKSRLSEPKPVLKWNDNTAMLINKNAYKTLSIKRYIFKA